MDKLGPRLKRRHIFRSIKFEGRSRVTFSYTYSEEEINLQCQRMHTSIRTIPMWGIVLKTYDMTTRRHGWHHRNPHVRCYLRVHFPVLKLPFCCLKFPNSMLLELQEGKFVGACYAGVSFRPRAPPCELPTSSLKFMILISQSSPPVISLSPVRLQQVTGP